MLLTEWNMETALEVRYDEGVTKGVAIGEARGVAIGEARGRTEGVAIGEAKGRTEVLDLLAKGYSVEQIKDALKGKLF